MTAWVSAPSAPHAQRGHVAQANAPVALVDAPKIRRMRAVAAPIAATMANGLSADASGARPRSASQRGVPLAAAITARVKRANARKRIAVARWAMAMPVGAPQRAAKPPIKLWIRMAARPAAAKRRTLPKTPGVLNAVSAVAAANAVTAMARMRWPYSTRGSQASGGSQLPLQSGQSLPHPDPAGCKRVRLPMAISARVERTVASANRYSRVIRWLCPLLARLFQTSRSSLL